MSHYVCAFVLKHLSAYIALPKLFTLSIGQLTLEMQLTWNVHQI